jgi:hypothetical protein
MITGPPPKFHGTRDILICPGQRAILEVDVKGLEHNFRRVAIFAHLTSRPAGMPSHLR